MVVGLFRPRIHDARSRLVSVCSAPCFWSTCNHYIFFLVYELPPSSYISYSLECARVCWLFELELLQSYSPILKLELIPFVLFVLSLRSMLLECTWHTLAGSLDTPHRLMPKASSCSRVTAHHFQFSTSCPGTVHCHDGQHDLSPVRLFTCSPDNVCC